MFDTIVQWLTVVPLEQPMRALAIVGITVVFSASLLGFWEMLFAVARWFTGAKRQSRAPAHEPVQKPVGEVDLLEKERA